MSLRICPLSLGRFAAAREAWFGQRASLAIRAIRSALVSRKDPG
jgi:hypothetical protein